MWLHAGIVHMLFNLLFLWIFGNAVCAKIGNAIYLPFYLLFGLLAGIAHLIFQGGAAIGASGAINGVVGMYVVFFPENEITCYWTLSIFYWKQFSVRSFWVILFWLVGDIFGAVLLSGQLGGVAYFSHLGGFATGFGLAILMLKTRMVTMERYERSLLEILAERKQPAQDEFDPRYRGFPHGLREIDSVESKTAQVPDVSTTSGVQEPVAESGLSVEDFFQEQFIRFTCSCGKRIKVPAKYAGKTGKCPACKRQLTIPEQSASGSKTTSPEPVKGPKQFIRFTCSCGKRLKVPASLAGRTGKCPNCKRRIQIQGR